MPHSDFVKMYLKQHLDPKYVYHNLVHTQQVVQAVEELANAAQLETAEIDLLKTAAWFHDIGYCKNWKNHEELGIEIARTYLEEQNYSAEQIVSISAIILATKIPHQAHNLNEQLIADADLSHLASANFMSTCLLLKKEWENTNRANYDSDLAWFKMEVEFLETYTFHSTYAKELYKEGKLKNIKLLKKQIKKLESSS